MLKRILENNINEDCSERCKKDAQEIINYVKKFEKIANSISTYCNFNFKKMSNVSAALIADDVVDPLELVEIIDKIKFPNDNTMLTIECINGNVALYFSVANSY